MTPASNLVLFQAGWIACALGAAHGMPWVGPPGAAAIGIGSVILTPVRPGTARRLDGWARP